MGIGPETRGFGCLIHLCPADRPGKGLVRISVAITATDDQRVDFHRALLTQLLGAGLRPRRNLFP